MNVGTWLVVIGGLYASAFAIFVAVRPGVTIRVQRNATQRATGARRIIGELFARWLRIDGLEEPWLDPGARTRVRIFGLVQLLIVVVVVAGLLIAIRS